jgi:hypothetical protein
MVQNHPKIHLEGWRTSSHAVSFRRLSSSGKGYFMTVASFTNCAEIDENQGRGRKQGEVARLQQQY